MTTIVRYVTGENFQKVREYVENGGDINLPDKNGMTALMFSLLFGYLDISKYLLSKGAELSSQTKFGNTPLIFASKYGQLNMVRFLISKGVNINHQNNGGYTALMGAVWYGYLGVVRLLVEKGADINMQDTNGDTALNLTSTSIFSSPDVVKYLTSLQGPLSLQHIILNLIEKECICSEELPEMLFMR